MMSCKKTMKTTLFGILIFMILLSFTSLAVAQELQFENFWAKVQKDGVLKIGVAPAEPHMMKDPKTGEWSGIAINVMKKMAEAAGVKLKCIDTSWDYIVAGAAAGKWDIAASIAERASRALVVNYSIPYAYMEISYAYNKNNEKLKNATKLEDFDKKGLTCAIMSGSAHDKAVTNIAKNMTIVRYPGMDEARMALLSGRADFMPDDAVTNYMFYLANPDMTKIFDPDPPIMHQPLGFGFRKTVPLEEIQVLDIVIRDCISSGLVDKWMQEFGKEVAKRMK